MKPVTIKRPAGVAEAIAALHRLGDTWHLPALRAAMAGAIRLAFLPPGARVPLRLLDPARDARPLLLILSGDAPGLDASPAAFPQTCQLLRWARRIMLHGAGGEPEHYELAVDAALAARRVLLVETPSAALSAWVAIAREVAPATPTLALMPPPGAPSHPMRLALQ